MKNFSFNHITKPFIGESQCRLSPTAHMGDGRSKYKHLVGWLAP